MQPTGASKVLAVNAALKHQGERKRNPSDVAFKLGNTINIGLGAKTFEQQEREKPDKPEKKHKKKK